MKIYINHNIELYYEVYGEGDPIVFSHGWMTDSSIWNSQIEFFSKKNKVIVYDHRGHGKSDKPTNDYSISALSEDLNCLIQKLNIEKFILVGHSMGGMMAMEFALNHQDKLSKLVLVSTSAKLDTSQISQSQVMAYIIFYESFARRMINFVYDEPSKEIQNEALKMAMKTPKFAAYKCYTEFKKFDIRDRIDEIKVPTLIIVGNRDKVTPVEMSQYLNNGIKASQLKILSDSSHMVMIDKSKEFNETLEEFIR